MTDRELADRRAQLKAKTERIAGMSAFAAASEIKTAALLAAAITDELARRELSRAAGGHIA